MSTKVDAALAAEVRRLHEDYERLRNDAEFAAQQAAPSVPDGCAIVSRTLTPEAWKRLCNADIWPVTPKSFQRMLDVLMEVALLQSADHSERNLAEQEQTAF